MKVDGFDIDVGIEGVLIEEDRAACILGHVEAACKNCRDQHPRTPPPNSRNLFFEGIFLHPSRSRVPVVDSEPLLHK